jgi:hypothetical protein
MRRSPPGLSCLLGLDLRKRPLADLTPEEPPPDEAAVHGAAEGDISLVVQETPTTAHASCKNDNPECVHER